MEKAQRDLSNINYREGLAEELQDQYKNLKYESKALDSKVEQMSRRYPFLDFKYTDPDRNFDRSLVKGVAANLMTVKDPKYYVALDTAGGGKVQNLGLILAKFTLFVMQYSETSLANRQKKRCFAVSMELRRL